MVQQNADEYADMLARALRRDMRSVQDDLLHAIAPGRSFDVPDVVDAAASAFARYTYPESFFVWRDGTCAKSLLFLHRSERLPPWSVTEEPQAAFPVAVHRDPAT